MGIQRAETFIHWNYFLALEEDLDRLSRYVDFSANDNTYSIEVARLFLSACSECDVILKQICKAINQDSEASSINTYYPELIAQFPQIINFEVTVPRHGLTLHPWSDWTQDRPPFWWKHHNKVKHRRHENFDKANLKNCLNSIAALYVTVLYLYQEPARNGDLPQLPKLFNVADNHFGGTKMGRLGVSFVYVL